MKRTARKILWGISGIILLVAMVTPFIKPTHSNSAVSITAPDGFSISCITGYTRVLPHYCQSNAGGTGFVITQAVACTAQNVGGAGSFAVGNRLELKVAWQPKSNNAIALRANGFATYKDSGCVAQWDGSGVAMREFAAVVAGTVLATIPDRPQAYVVDTTGGHPNIYTVFTNIGGAGNADVATISIMGYYD